MKTQITHIKDMNMLYDYYNNKIIINKELTHPLRSFDEYNRQGRGNPRPPKHGGLYTIPFIFNSSIYSKKMYGNILLIPVSSAGDLWHSFHHLFICYTAIKNLNIHFDNIIFYIFTTPHDRKREKRIKQLKNPYLLELFYKIANINKPYKDFIQEYQTIYNSFLYKNVICIENLYIPTIDIDFSNIEAIKSHMSDFKHYLLQQYCIKPTENKHILIVCRRPRPENKKIKNRQYKNQLEIEQWAKEYSDKINYVYLEDYSFKEQLEFFVNAKIVVGAHGCGLTWVMFMEEQTTLIELFPINGGYSQWNDYLFWSNLSNIKYKRKIL